MQQRIKTAIHFLTTDGLFLPTLLTQHRSRRIYAHLDRKTTFPSNLSIHLGSQGLRGLDGSGDCRESKSEGRKMRVPGLSGLDHGVELDETLSHASHESDFGWFACSFPLAINATRKGGGTTISFVRITHLGINWGFLHNAPKRFNSDSSC
jgi:hypothetical protein